MLIIVLSKFRTPGRCIRYGSSAIGITLANKFRVIYGNTRRRAVAEPSAAGIILYKCFLIAVDVNKIHEERITQWKNRGQLQSM